ncbi:hypothetical protein H5V45_19250 [Nocardioides sp. KIGAM211]|uniref:Uncharacterized protein n=1 Tax=Nocardioides luti TaxID=2761101 RepID=A0A7X0VC80_9ACTN|nr:hypothetical protein [Nocardioides luti]MBB6629471.1 hypothetical protein [Nocardioides luti]
MRRTAVAVAVLALLPLASACGGTPKEEYCAAVKDHQAELTDLVGSGGDDALIKALPIFEELQDKALSDIADEWQQVVSRIKALQGALEDAGVDPASYDRDKPPAGLDDDQRAAIDAAARELGSGPTLAALQAVDQEARDVCQTPLTLSAPS